MTQININALAKRKMYQLLEINLINLGDGIVRYKEDSVLSSDKAIAEKVQTCFVNSDITVSKVTGLRNRAWGTLPKPIPLETQIKLLKEENAKLKTYLTDVAHPENIEVFLDREDATNAN